MKENRESQVKKDIQVNNVRYLLYRVRRDVSVNKLLFILTLMLEAFVFVFGLFGHKNSAADKSDVIFLLIIYIVVAIPFLISSVSAMINRMDLQNLYNSAHNSIEDETGEEISALISEVKDANTSQISILIIAFVFYAAMIF